MLIGPILDTALAVRDLFDRFELSRWHEARSAIDRFEPASLHAHAESLLRSRAIWIRGRLRCYPYWAAGHLELARVSLRVEDVATAYAGAQATLKLRSTGRLARGARLVLGRTYLRRGEWERAIEVLELLQTTQPDNPAILEDLAAAFIGAGQHARAVEALIRIPQERLSAEGRAALSFAQLRSPNESKG